MYVWNLSPSQPVYLFVHIARCVLSLFMCQSAPVWSGCSFSMSSVAFMCLYGGTCEPMGFRVSITTHTKYDVYHTDQPVDTLVYFYSSQTPVRPVVLYTHISILSNTTYILTGAGGRGSGVGGPEGGRPEGGGWRRVAAGGGGGEEEKKSHTGGEEPPGGGGGEEEKRTKNATIRARGRRRRTRAGGPNSILFVLELARSKKRSNRETTRSGFRVPLNDQVIPRKQQEDTCVPDTVVICYEIKRELAPLRTAEPVPMSTPVLKAAALVGGSACGSHR